MNTHYRQGDVLIERVSHVPPENSDDGQTRQAKEPIILAHGEATGHAHTIEQFEGISVRAWKESDALLLSLPKPATVTHQEHAPIVLPAGDYMVTKQREYAPQEIRRVAD